MSFVKVLFCLAFAIVAVSATDLKNRKAEPGLVAPPALPPKGSRAVVSGSNLPLADQQEIGLRYQQIFNSMSDPSDQAEALQVFLEAKYPFFRNNVFVGYYGVAYFQKYYIFLYAGGYDYVLAFGL